MRTFLKIREKSGGVETQLPRLVVDQRGQGAGLSAVLNPGRAGGVETQLPRMVADLWGQGAGLSAVLNQGRAGVTRSSIVHPRRLQQ